VVGACGFWSDDDGKGPNRTSSPRRLSRFMKSNVAFGESHRLVALVGFVKTTNTPSPGCSSYLDGMMMMVNGKNNKEYLLWKRGKTDEEKGVMHDEIEADHPSGSPRTLFLQKRNVALIALALSPFFCHGICGVYLLERDDVNQEIGDGNSSNQEKSWKKIGSSPQLPASLLHSLHVHIALSPHSAITTRVWEQMMMKLTVNVGEWGGSKGHQVKGKRRMLMDIII